MAEGLPELWRESLSAGDTCWSDLWVVFVANENLSSSGKVGVSEVSHKVHTVVWVS